LDHRDKDSRRDPFPVSLRICDAESSPRRGSSLEFVAVPKPHADRGVKATHQVAGVAAESLSNLPNVGPQELRNAWLCLISAGAAYFVAELVLFSLDRAISWDEAVYLSQVTPGMSPLPFEAARARGITLLAWPVMQFGGSLVAVRLLLAMCSAAALVSAFAPWVSVIGFGAALAAVLFGSTWVALFYGSELMPNLWVALFAVSSLGFFGRFLSDRRTPWDLPLSSLLLALLGVFRPPDVIPVALAMGAVGIWAGAMSFKRIAVVLAGVVAGWLPWIVEMRYRFGGVSEALRHAQAVAQVSTSSLGSRFIQHLAVLDGPTIGPVDTPHPSIAGIAWWSSLLALAIGGVVGAKQTPLFRPLLAALLAGIGLAAEYLVFVDRIAPRFLLPSYALLSIPAAWAICILNRRVRWHPARVILIVVFVGPWTVWQIETANRIEGQAEVSRGSLEEVGTALRELTGERFCSFASSDGFPQIAFASGCDGHRLRLDSAQPVKYVEESIAPGHRGYLISRTLIAPHTSSTEALLVLVLRASNQEKWFIQELVPRNGWTKGSLSPSHRSPVPG